jgi:uncharacterized membrane protein
LYSLLDDGLMTNTFDDYLYDGVDVNIFFLWCILCDVSITITYSHSLSKVFRCNFLVTMRKVEILESYSTRDKAGRRAMGSITS